MQIKIHTSEKTGEHVGTSWIFPIAETKWSIRIHYSNGISTVAMHDDRVGCFSPTEHDNFASALEDARARLREEKTRMLQELSDSFDREIEEAQSISENCDYPLEEVA